MTAPKPLRAELRALVLQQFISDAEKEVAALKTEMAPSYPLPTTVVFESPLDGAKLGHVNRARTKPEWKVTAREQFNEHIATVYPGALVTVYLLAVPGIEAPVPLPEDHPITQALLQAAPDLLTPERRVPDDVVEAALQESRDTGQPAAPGIQLVRPRQGALSVVPDKREAPGAIRRLIAAEQVSWSELVPGSVLALPVGDEQREAS